jgi:hypothetical protein
MHVTDKCTGTVLEARSESVAASVRVVEALADATDTDPRALDPPLSSAVDPDALDALDALVASDADACVTFEYADHRVVVGDETVTVEQPVATTPSDRRPDDDD